MDLDLNIYSILEIKYLENNKLPVNWNEIKNIKIKNELLSIALNNYKKIEELEEYINITKELEND